MSINDAANESENSEIENTHGDANNLESEVENANGLAPNASEAEEEIEEYEVVDRTQEPSPDAEQKKHNAAMAKKRIEAREAKKRAEAAELQLEQIKQGNIPEHLKETLVVAPTMPDQPNIQDFVSEEALAKYDYDKDMALAAFTQANNKWLLDAQSARSTSQASEVQKRNEFIQQEMARVDSAKQYNKAADELNISGFEDAEKAFIATAQESGVQFVNDIFPADPKKAVAVVNFLGRNPDELDRISRLNPTQQVAEIAILGSQKLELRKKNKANVAEADSVLQGGETSPNQNWKKQLSEVLASGDNTKFRQLKKEWESKLGRSIAYSEI